MHLPSFSTSALIDRMGAGDVLSIMTGPTRWRIKWGGPFLALTTLALSALALPMPALAEKHFVWRVTGRSTPFYLVGSLHSLTKEDYPLPPAYLQALSETDRLIFEYNPRQNDALTRKFREVASYPSGRDVRSDLRPASLALLRKNLWKFGFTFDQVRPYRPWAIALRLLAEQGPIGPSNPLSMESYLVSQARRSGQEIGGLETIDEHVAFWREMLERDGENLLLYTLVRGRKVSELFAKTRAAWKSGDVAALSATNARLHRANAGLALRLLDRRNAKWISRIEAEMKTGKPTAIVAGAGHFSGPDSVIALLEKRGYKIEQL